MMPALKAPGSKRLKLEHEKLLSKFAFIFNLRRYTVLKLRRLTFQPAAAWLRGHTHLAHIWVTPDRH
jgi:hypothetical protein